MKRVVFIDDEQLVLSGLQRMLRPMRHQWDMVFHASPLAALDDIRLHGADVVVTDIDMPEMRGIELLEHIRSEFPETVRFVLSGNTDAHILFLCSNVAHQYLAKPCNPDELQALFTRATYLRSRLRNSTLKKRLMDAGALPSMPAVYNEVMAALREATTPVAEVAKIIERDPALSAKILQIANTVYVGSRSEVSSVAKACSTLGLANIKDLVLTAEVFKPAADFSLPAQFSLDDLWSHSLAVAAYSRIIMASECDDRRMQDAAFTAGLLHEIGQIVLATRVPELYVEACNYAAARGTSLARAERALFDADHDEVAGFVLDLWGMPDNIVEAITFHQHPYCDENSGFTTVTALHVGNYLALSKEATTAADMVDSDYLVNLGLDGRIGEWYDACMRVPRA